MFYICREMGWDYWIYQKQPQFFLDVVLKMLDKEAREIKKWQNKHKS